MLGYKFGSILIILYCISANAVLFSVCNISALLTGTNLKVNHEQLGIITSLTYNFSPSTHTFTDAQYWST